MEVVRQVVDSSLLSSIKLPRHLRNRKVEIIIMPIEEPIKKKKKPVDGLIGILHNYSNPDLAPSEKGAWARAMEEKHADS
jgi:hypothetical protein